MHAASRESYATAVDRLRALDADPQALASVGDEVLAMAALLAREPRLRRALSDPARAPDDRVGLLRALLGGAGPGGKGGGARAAGKGGGARAAGKGGGQRLGGHAADLVAVLVAGRWSTPSELLEATERLGVETLLISADKAGTLADVEDELFRFGQIVEGDPALAAELSDHTVEPSRRAGLARTLLEGRTDPVTLRLVELALAGFGGRSFVGGLSRLVELAAARRERQVAYVTVAAPLSEDDERRLGEKLSALYRREVTLKITVDPRIVGGVSVRVGDDLYDGTVIRRINETRNALVGR